MFVGESKSTSRPLPPSRNLARVSFGGGTASAENCTDTSTSETLMPSKNRSSLVTACWTSADREAVSPSKSSVALTETERGAQSSGPKVSVVG